MFIIQGEDNFISLISDKLSLTYVAPKYSLSSIPEYYINNSSKEYLESPYLDIEQALDDFEYSLKFSIPSTVISSFKSRIKGNKINLSDARDRFEIVEDDNFIILRNNDKNIQLNCMITTDNLSFNITDSSFEVIPDYEVIASNFTDDSEEALDYFKDMVGKIPENILNKFQDLIN